MKKSFLMFAIASSIVSCSTDNVLQENISLEQQNKSSNTILEVPRSARKLYEIANPATHNTYNYKGRFRFSNVFDDMPKQFDKGIRAVEIDIHEKINLNPFKGNDISVYHGKFTNGANKSRLAHYVLREITDFIEANPSEIVYLKFETTVSGKEIDKVIKKAGLDKHIYRGIASNPYPTPQEVISSGKRVLITRQIGGSKYGPSLPRHTFGGGHVDNGDHKPQSSPSNSKYFSIERYGITPGLGFGDADKAKYLNHPSRLAAFVDDVWKLNGKKPWRVIVDFPSVHNNNYYKVMKALNEKEMLKTEIRDSKGKLLSNKHWSWQCQYSNETVTARTSAEASFPLNDNETVTIRPTSSSYRFEPESVTISNQNNTDYKQIFTAIPL